MSKSTIILSRGGGHLKYEKKHQRFRNVAECLVQSKLSPRCKNGNEDIFMEHCYTYFFNADIFMEQIFV